MGRLAILLLFILSWSSAYSRIAPRKNNNSEILKYEKELHRLNLKISSIEKKLQKENRSYVRTVKDRNKTEGSIHQIQRLLEEERAELDSELAHSKNLLKGVILSRLDDDRTPAQLLASNLLMKKLKSKISTIKDQRVFNTRRQGDLKKLEKKMQMQQRSEHEIISRLGHLERKKQEIAHKYVETIEKKENIVEKIRSVQNKKLSKSKRKFKEGIFISPVKKYERIEKDGGDLKYIFKGSMPIFAPRKGRVTAVQIARYWSGSVIIDHGEKIHSLVYGAFSAVVKEGDWVEQGKLIGWGTTIQKTKAEVKFGIRMGSKIVDASRFINITK